MLNDRYVREALATLAAIFDNQLQAAGGSRMDLRAATIDIDLAAGTCMSQIGDDRGTAHAKPVVQWGGVDWEVWRPVFESLRP